MPINYRCSAKMSCHLYGAFVKYNLNLVSRLVFFALEYGTAG